MTPLWTERNDLADFDVGPREALLDPSQVLPVADLAATMANLVEDGKYTGGTIYQRSEVSDEVVIEGIGDEEKKATINLPQTKKVSRILASERKGGK